MTSREDPAAPKSMSRHPLWRRVTVLGVGLLSLVGIISVAAPSVAASGATKPAKTPVTRPNVSTASGTLAAIIGTDTLEVQNPTSGQVTVTVTASTAITQTVSVPASTLAAGQCVSAVGTASKSGIVTARSVTITQTTSSSCTGGFGGAGGFVGGAGGFGGGVGGAGGFAGGAGGFGGGGGGFRGGFGGGGGGTPSSFPGRPRTGAADFSLASGKLLSVSGSKLEVKGVELIPPKAAKSSSKKATTKGGSTAPKFKTKSVTKTVKVTSKTTFSKISTATSSALAMNQCVTAVGPANDQGAITATRLSISAPGPSGCSAGFAGFGGSFAGRGGSNGAATN
jgi:hypothetical protein